MNLRRSLVFFCKKHINGCNSQSEALKRFKNGFNILGEILYISLNNEFVI